MGNTKKITDKSLKLEDILLDTGKVDRDLLEDCITEAHNAALPLEHIIVQKNVLESSKLAQLLSNRLHIPYISTETYEVSKEIIEKYPKGLFHKYQFVPLDKIENALIILVSGVVTREMIKELEETTKCEIFIFIGTIEDVKESIHQHVGEPEADDQYSSQVIPEEQALTAGWQSIFDLAEESVQADLKEKATNVLGLDSEEENFEEFEEFAEATAQHVNQEFLSEDDIPLPTLDDEEEDLAAGIAAEMNFGEGDSETAGGDGLSKLAEHLEQNPFDYDAINNYVETATQMGEIKLAVDQLTAFAWRLDQAGRHEEAVNCYEYILDLEPDNAEAKRRLNK